MIDVKGRKEKVSHVKGRNVIDVTRTINHGIHRSIHSLLKPVHGCLFIQSSSSFNIPISLPTHVTAYSAHTSAHFNEVVPKVKPIPLF